MRVNLISIFYWPEGTGIGPYSAGAAEYLADHGDDVTAITGVPHFPAWKRDPDSHVPGAASRNGVRIVRFDHHIPARHNALRRALYELSFFVSVAASQRLPQADFTVAVVPNVAAAYIALSRRRTGGPYGVIVQDVSSRAATQSGTPGGRLASNAASLVEGVALRSASFVGVVSPSFATPLIEMGVRPEKIVNLPNWTHVARPTRRRADVREMFGWGPGTTVALHAGNMGRKQALETVIDSARAAARSDAPVEFVLMGDGNQRIHLQEYARGASRLKFLAPQSDDLFADVLGAADVLLLSERASVRDMSLPSKLTSYFSAGRPIVGAIPDEGSSATELRRSGAGVTVPAEDPDALLAAVLGIRRDLDLANSLGKAGLRYSESSLRPEHTLRELRRAIRAATGNAAATT